MSGYIFPNLRQAQLDNGEAFHMAVAAGSPSVTYASGSVSSSTDVFTSKTNKFAESKLVRIIASAAAHVKWGSSLPTATTSDFYIPANVATFFVVGDGQAYCAVIPTTGSASFWTTECY